MATSKVKKNGVVYTPTYIVEMILEQSNYNSGNIIKKHVIDNSCGDGKFLVEIVKRYINEFIKNKGLDIITKSELKSDLEQYIHGIELDEEEVIKCINNLNEVVSLYGLENIKWDVNQGDTLQVSKYNGMMDYVLGNPPYVRVHNLSDNFNYIKSQKFTSSGMTDLFIIFYEIGIEMLNETGVLGYITPSSIFNSVAGSEFRKYVTVNKLLTSVIDLKHFQAFDNFMTYTAIITLDKKNNRGIVEYSRFDSNNYKKVFVDYLSYDEFYLNGYFYFSERQNLLNLKEILEVDIKTKNIEVKNGFATLADGIFISNKFDFKSKYIRKVIKASRKKWYQIIYPYNEDGKIVDFRDFEIELQNYFNLHYDHLTKRSLDKNSLWYSFGRTQGINDFWKTKIAINSLIKDLEDIKLEIVNPGEGVYSGLYILSDIGYDIIKEKLLSDDFLEYVAILGKYKSGGYYTFSSSDLKKFLVYKLERSKK